MNGYKIIAAISLICIIVLVSAEAIAGDFKTALGMLLIFWLQEIFYFAKK